MKVKYVYIDGNGDVRQGDSTFMDGSTDSDIKSHIKKHLMLTNVSGRWYKADNYWRFRPFGKKDAYLFIIKVPDNLIQYEEPEEEKSLLEAWEEQQ